MAKYKVLIPELSVPRSIGELRDIYGNVVGQSHVNKTYFQNDVLDEDDVSPVVRDQIAEGKLDGRLEEVSDGTEAGPYSIAPIEGYDDLSVEQVRGLFEFLPSETIQRVKEYERDHGENRPEIAEYSIGLGESSVDRLNGTVGSERDDAVEGETAEVTTREVGEDSVQFGESVTGDGQPDVEPGTAKRAKKAPAAKKATRSSRSKASKKEAEATEENDKQE